MGPYLEVLRLTIDSWRPRQDLRTGWKTEYVYSLQQRGQRLAGDGELSERSRDG